MSANRDKKQNPYYEWAAAMVRGILPVVLIFTFAFRIVGVKGSSMYPTLEENDKLIISDMFYTPEYHDVVVLSKAAYEDGQPIVKRVIATEGEMVEIDFDNGIVYIDGKELYEDYINEPTYMSLDMTGPVVVPEDHVFVMGDNRNASTDSRYKEIGMVHEDRILGQVIFRFLPFDSIGVID